MLRTRAEMKAIAKSILKRSYWGLVVVSLLLLVVSGGFNNDINVNQNRKNITNSIQNAQEGNLEEFDFDMMEDDFDPDAFIDVNPSGSPVEHDGVLGVLERLLQVGGGVFGVLLGVIGIVGVLLILAFSIGLSIFLLNPLMVGIRRYFLVSLDGPAKVGELGYAFDQNYWNSVKTMFWMNLKLALWFLLLIIPSIIKSFEYMMIPYLLAERPDMTCEEAFQASKQLMNGNKWRAFVLRLSFIGWRLLSAFTFGLVNIFFVNPYYNMTEAVFYQTLCMELQGAQNG